MQKKSLYSRVCSSMPLLITLIVHLVLIGVAGAIVVQQSMGGKKRTFEAATANEGPAKQVEHRLQVARRSGASSGATSPVSANRIFSTAAGAVTMPEMPELPVSSAGGFGGFGSAGSGINFGAGSGMSTSLGGGSGLGGRGFMSLSFLGTTSQNSSKIVFVVDTSQEIMEPRKGGFQAFGIIREEIIRLVNRLPPSAKFNVILFAFGQIYETQNIDLNLFRSELVPATSDTKKSLFAWMSPVNTRLDSYGPATAADRNTWKPRELPASANVDPDFIPAVWARATRAALEQQPDVIYVITANQGVNRRRVDQAVVEKRREQQQKARETFDKEMSRMGLDAAAVLAARDAAHRKAREELDAINRRLVEQKKDPVVLGWIGALESPEVQAELKRSGASLRFDSTGWTDKQGKRINVPFFLPPPTTEEKPWTDFNAYYARLQSALAPTRPILNIFLFVGPQEKAEDATRNLTSVAKRNGGTFQLLTTRRLEALKAQAEKDTSTK